MNPEAEAILATIQTGFQFGIELLKYLQTDAGQKAVTQTLASEAAIQAGFSRLGTWLEQLFKGQLSK